MQILRINQKNGDAFQCICAQGISLYYAIKKSFLYMCSILIVFFS